MRRRDVLRFLAALGAVGALPGAGAWARKMSGGGDAARDAKAGGSKGREPVKYSWRAGKQLVVVLLAGGPDSLSLAAPTADPLYASLRPTTALPRDCGGLDLGEGFVLHPALGALAPLYEQKKLAVIPACGMPGVVAAHAPALEDFERGMPEGAAKGARGGWLARLALALCGERAQIVTATPSGVYAGAAHYNMIAPGRGPAVPPLPVEDQALFEAVGKLFSRQGALGKAFVAGRGSRQELLARYLAEARRSAAAAIPAPTFAAFGERFGSELAKRRDAAAAFLAVGGFDTHSCQGGAKGYLADRLRETAQGLAGMVSGLGKAFDDTVIIALGEFGRSVRENGFGGTDNGHGGIMFILGGPTAGGKILGEWPGLSTHRLMGGIDLPMATDWRDVASVIAVRHMGLPDKKIADVFPGFAPAISPPGVMA